MAFLDVFLGPTFRALRKRIADLEDANLDLRLQVAALETGLAQKTAALNVQFSAGGSLNERLIQKDRQIEALQGSIARLRLEIADLEQRRREDRETALLASTETVTLVKKAGAELEKARELIEEAKAFLGV
jgi:chromosome segregation ATPase